MEQAVLKRGILHLHEVGELGAFTFELIAERTNALSMHGKVTISHAFALSSVDAARQGALIELLARNDIALTTVAPGRCRATHSLPVSSPRSTNPE